MSESSQRRASASSENIGTIVPRNFAPEKLSTFGKVCLTLWPEKPGVILAQRIGCSERAANFYISGGREPSTDALLVIVDEIRGRRRA
jgi:hypothetical protein